MERVSLDFKGRCGKGETRSYLSAPSPVGLLDSYQQERRPAVQEKTHLENTHILVHSDYAWEPKLHVVIILYLLVDA